MTTPEHARATRRLLLILGTIVIVGGCIAYVLAYRMPGSVRQPVSQVTESTTLPAATSTTSIPTKPVAPVVLDTSITITNADSNLTIHLTKDEAFVLQLDNGLRWSTISFDPASSVVQVKAASADTQGSFKAVKSGTITLTATGAPICKAGQACPMFLERFTVTLVVT